LHFLGAEEIAHLYPELSAFQAIRAELDPEGIFTNDYLARLGLTGETSESVR
jgi:FAD/FMN-containing dehydrogenase